MKTGTWLKLGAAVLGLGITQSEAFALVYKFENVALQSPDYAGQLSMDVTDAGGGFIQFKFMNSGPIAGRIAGISFQDLNGDLSNLLLLEPAGVDFKSGGGANIPSSIAFTETAAFELKKNGAAANGIDPGEFLGVKFNGAYRDVIDDLNSGSIAVGLHVISIGNFQSGGSQKFENDIPEVPDGGSTALLLGIAALALPFFNRKKD